MGTTTGRAIAGLVIAGLAGLGAPTIADATDAQTSPRVRSNNSTLAALITRGTEQSITFRGLIDAIKASDGIVYVEPGRCRYSRACLVGVTGLGGYRILRVSVVLRHADTDLMAFIGHELQHAIEILSNPHVRNTEDIYLFYSRIGRRGKSGVDFETTAAIKAENAVREEIRAFKSRCGSPSMRSWTVNNPVRHIYHDKFHRIARRASTDHLRG